MKDEVKEDILSGDYDRLYKTKDWKYKRIEILKRDKYECQRCKGIYRNPKYPIKKIELNRANTVHHIVELKDDLSRMLDDGNLISLCRKCHDIIHERTTEFLNKPKKRVTDERW